MTAFIPDTLVTKIVDLLESIPGFKEAPVTSRYEAIRGRVGNRIVIIYRSGSVVYDEALEEVRSLLEEALHEHYKEEGIVVGSDEAGKGETLGPLVVAATALTPRQAAYLQSIGVADSKIIPENRVPELARRIRQRSLEYSVLKIEPLKLNEMFRMKEKYGNLNDILARGHRQVLKRIVSKTSEKPTLVIIDKFDSSKDGVRMRLIKKALGGLRVKAVEGGEVFPSVAAASILARESYLRWVRRNTDKEILEKIRKGDYAAIGSQEKMEYYFKICYIKKG